MSASVGLCLVCAKKFVGEYRSEKLTDLDEIFGERCIPWYPVVATVGAIFLKNLGRGLILAFLYTIKSRKWLEISKI